MFVAGQVLAMTLHLGTIFSNRENRPIFLRFAAFETFIDSLQYK